MPLTNIIYTAGQDTMQGVFDKTNLAIDKIDELDVITAAINTPILGGTANQVLRKVSGTNYDYAWSDNDDAQAFTTTTTNNGQTITASSAVTISGLTNYFRYYVKNKICHLDFDIQFTVTSGATVSYIRIPLPIGITKTITALDPRYSNKGPAGFAAPTGTTTYAACMVKAIDSAVDGQYLQIVRIDETVDIVMSNVATTITGHIEFLVD